MRWLLPRTVHTVWSFAQPSSMRAAQRDLGAVQPAEMVEHLAEHTVVRAEARLEHHGARRIAAAASS